MQRGKREARRQECVCTSLIVLTDRRVFVVIDFEFEHLFRVGLILPLYGGRDSPRVRDGYGQVANDHQKLVQPARKEGRLALRPLANTSLTSG
jgi:hypothetical protein